MISLYKDKLWSAILKYFKFFGPGIMVSVAYMDPGNYSTSVAAGSSYKFTLLFSIFISNLFAIVLQCLCIKLGSVTGLNLAENCRKHLPNWLNLIIYFFAEFSIIATDLAEVIGTAIALNILFNIPLEIGIILTILDVLIILFCYNNDGNLKEIKIFELIVSFFVFLTFICFILLLNNIDLPDKLDILKGFLPLNPIILEKKAIYLSLGILGATVMPHSLYLGSAIVQPRLKDYDIKHGNYIEPTTDEEDSLNHNQNNNTIISPSDNFPHYKPSLQAIKYSLNYSYTELIVSLFIIAVFVNSAILIVAGGALYGQPDAEDADLLTIYEMLKNYVSPMAGLLFAIAMLSSGQSAGIICTMVGQIVSEGFINWNMNPSLRRVITRLITIVPCLIVVIILGREGIADVLNMSQVILSLILPFVSAPLLYFTCNKDIMKVEFLSKIGTTNSNTFNKNSAPSASTFGSVSLTPSTSSSNLPPLSTSTPLRSESNEIISPAETDPLLNNNHSQQQQQQTMISFKDYSNGKTMTFFAFLTWGSIAFLNFYLIIQFLRGEDIHF